MSTGELIERTGASCRLWTEGPDWDGPAAAVGALVCADAASGRAVLEEAAERARAAGAMGVLGPMEGDTWHAYRLPVWSDGTPPFPMEPDAPPHHLAAFEAAGFTPVAHYASAIDEAIAAPRSRADIGLRIRPWRAERAEEELASLHALSLEAFAGNRFFRPIALYGFRALYAPFVPRIDPETVLIAEDDTGAMQGFLFAFPDPLDPRTPPRIVVKTYAARRPGAGALLFDRLRETARARGTPALVHALFHLENRSAAISRHRGGRIFRRYALLGRRLAP